MVTAELEIEESFVEAKTGEYSITTILPMEDEWIGSFTASTSYWSQRVTIERDRKPPFVRNITYDDTELLKGSFIQCTIEFSEEVFLGVDGFCRTDLQNLSPTYSTGKKRSS